MITSRWLDHNPLHPNNSMLIPSKFPKVLTRRIVGDHFLHSHDLNLWFRGDIVRRNKMLVTLKGSKGSFKRAM